MHSRKLSLLTAVAELAGIHVSHELGPRSMFLCSLAVFSMSSAPMPFLLGMNSDWMDEMFHEEIMSKVDDVVIPDIDHSIITVPAHPKCRRYPPGSARNEQLQGLLIRCLKIGKARGTDLCNDLGAVRLCISVCGASMM